MGRFLLRGVWGYCSLSFRLHVLLGCLAVRSAIRFWYEFINHEDRAGPIRQVYSGPCAGAGVDAWRGELAGAGVQCGGA